MFISFVWGVFVRGVFGEGGFCPGGFCPDTLFDNCSVSTPNSKPTCKKGNRRIDHSGIKITLLASYLLIKDAIKSMRSELWRRTYMAVSKYPRVLY